MFVNRTWNRSKGVAVPRPMAPPVWTIDEHPRSVVLVNAATQPAVPEVSACGLGAAAIWVELAPPEVIAADAVKAFALPPA